MFATRSLFCSVLAGVALFFPSMQAIAAPKAKKPPAAISIENGRSLALTSFEIAHIEATPKAGAKPKPPKKAIGQLSEPLAPGEKKSLKLSGATGCKYLARWKFEDAGDEGQIDICGDPKIVLTD